MHSFIVLSYIVNVKITAPFAGAIKKNQFSHDLLHSLGPQVTGDKNLQLLLLGLHLLLPGGARGSSLGAMAWIPRERGFMEVRAGTTLTEMTLSRSDSDQEK